MMMVRIPDGSAWHSMTDDGLKTLVGLETTIGVLVGDRFPQKVRIVAVRRHYPERTLWAQYEEIDNGG